MMKQGYHYLTLICLILQTIESNDECKMPSIAHARITQEQYKEQFVFPMTQQIPSGLGYLLLLIDICLAIKEYSKHKKEIKNLSYDEFIKTYTNLVPMQRQIQYVQELLYRSKHGSLPEQIMARINLVCTCLGAPYDKVMNQCAKKLYESSFDTQARFVYQTSDPAEQAYKKFYKKVPQNYRDLARSLSKVKKNFQETYKTIIADKIDNEHNQTLLDIVYAGIAKNYPRLRQLCRSGYDYTIDKLYQYYENQKNTKNRIDQKDVSFAKIVEQALHYSSWQYDNVIQQIADALLYVIIVSCELRSDASDEQWDEQINTLYNMLMQYVDEQNIM